MKITKFYFHPPTNYILDCSSGVLLYNTDARVFSLAQRIGRQELRVLACLLEYEDMLVSKSQLLAEAWSGRIVSDNTINVTISRLRTSLRLIDPHSHSLLTRRNLGFIFSLRSAGLIPIVSYNELLAFLD